MAKWGAISFVKLKKKMFIKLAKYSNVILIFCCQLGKING